MKVMILAAGRGERMGSLTDSCPKPLLKVAGKPLIEHHILALKAQGFSEFVINVAYLGQQIIDALGSGQRWGVDIVYSDEGSDALETGGGIYNALPLLGDGHFMVVNADVWMNYPFASLRNEVAKNVHLVLVPNPQHHLSGDFALSAGVLLNDGAEKYTYSGIGVYHPSLFNECCAGKFPLAPIIRHAIQKGQATAELHDKTWIDVGTPERLADAENQIKVNLD